MLHSLASNKHVYPRVTVVMTFMGGRSKEKVASIRDKHVHSVIMLSCRESAFQRRSNIDRTPVLINMLPKVLQRIRAVLAHTRVTRHSCWNFMQTNRMKRVNLEEH